MEGLAEGLIETEILGDMLGDIEALGDCEGDLETETEGLILGLMEGEIEALGLCEGLLETETLGLRLGLMETETLGDRDGLILTETEGDTLGLILGEKDVPAASFTENEEAIIAANSVLAIDTAPVADAVTIALYEACTGSPPELAFCKSVYPDGVVIVPVTAVSHPQKTVCIVFATPVVMVGAFIVPVLAESSFAAFAVFGATSKLREVPEKQMAIIPHLPEAPDVKLYVDGSPPTIVRENNVIVCPLVVFGL